MTITSYNQLEVAYEVLLLYTNNKKNNKPYVIELKKAIRNFHKRQEEKTKDIINVFDSDYDGYTKLQALPEYIETFEEAKEYFEEYLYIPVYRTYYDCTGKPLTSWHKICKRNNRFYVYHRINYDV